MQVKIESCTRDLRPLRGSQDQETLYTGVKITVDGQTKWVSIKGDHRNLYNKVVDLEINGAVARFTNPQKPPAPAEQPPPPRPGLAVSNGHTPKWATREDAVDAYVFYATRIGEYIQDPLALVRGANCLMMLESQGEINPIHRKISPVLKPPEIVVGEDGAGVPF